MIKYYYLCQRCNYLCGQKIDMKRHLDKKNKCKIQESKKTTSEKELYDKSLIKIYNPDMNTDTESVISIVSDLTSKESNEHICNKCMKQFSTKSNLIKHIRKDICKKNMDETIDKNVNVQNIGVQNVTNITNNQFNFIINNNVLRGFDEDWDVSNIDELNRNKLVFSKTPFSHTLEKLLKNDSNLNVIVNDENSGYVYKNKKNKYEMMSLRDIAKESMVKIRKHLNDFYGEILIKSELDGKAVNEDLIRVFLNEIEKKYRYFLRYDEYMKLATNSFTSIFNEKKEKALEIKNSIEKDETIEYNVDNFEEEF